MILCSVLSYASLGIDNLRIKPQLERKYTGLKVKFKCRLNNPYWFHKKPTGKILSKSHEYSIPLVSLKNSGYYYCFGKKRNKGTLAKALLKVYGKNLHSDELGREQSEIDTNRCNEWKSEIYVYCKKNIY